MSLNSFIIYLLIYYLLFFLCPQAIAIMEVAHGKDHHYVAEVKREVEEQK